MKNNGIHKNKFRKLTMILTGILLAAFFMVPVFGASKAAMTTSFKTVSTWRQGNEVYTQMSVTLRNPNKEKITNWILKLNMDRKIALSSSWNGVYSVNNKTLTVRPASYNKTIPGKGTAEIGFILKSSAKANCRTMSGTIWNGTKKSSISRSVGKKIVPTPTPTVTPTPKPVREQETVSGTPLSQNGRLKVKGTKLVNEKGKTVILKGVSTHGINWFPQYVNKNTFKTMRDSWGVQCIRLAMYTEEYNGYCSGGNKNELKKLVQNGVKYATDLGMYVIIDWHILSDGNPEKNQKEAEAFFKDMSSRYKNHKNVIYEICNEPNNGTSWNTIRSYASSVIKTIRKNDKNAVILVGTPTWSQDVDIAAKNPLKGFSNIMYTFHFYAATHKDSYRDKVETAVKKGLPVFVSEFGVSEASGSGRTDTAEAGRWISFLKKNGISYVCWNLSNKDESCALLKSSCTKTSGFSSGDLSPAGTWFKKLK